MQLGEGELVLAREKMQEPCGPSDSQSKGLNAQEGKWGEECCPVVLGCKRKQYVFRTGWHSTVLDIYAWQTAACDASGPDGQVRPSSPRPD